MSATQAWPNVAEVLCQSKQTFGSYSIFSDDRFFCVTLYITWGFTWFPPITIWFRVESHHAASALCFALYLIAKHHVTVICFAVNALKFSRQHICFTADGNQLDSITAFAYRLMFQLCVSLLGYRLMYVPGFN